MNFVPGGTATSKQTICVDIGLRDDAILEAAETFAVRVNKTKGPEGIMIVDGLAKVTIIDNDFVTVGLESAEYTAVEGNGFVSVCVKLRGQIEGNTSVVAALHPTENGSAQGRCTFLSKEIFYLYW